MDFLYITYVIINGLIATMFLAVCRRLGTDIGNEAFREELWGIKKEKRTISPIKFTLIRITTLAAYTISFYITGKGIVDHMPTNAEMMKILLIMIYLFELILGNLLLWGIVKINVIKK